jgi:hypothetical protein
VVEVVDVFLRRYGTEYLQKFGKRMLPSPAVYGLRDKDTIAPDDG